VIPTVRPEAGVFTNMEIWAEIRRRVLTGAISKRRACVEYEIHWQTLKKILAHEEPPGFQAKAPRDKPKLGPFLPIIHQILDADRTAPRKQRHTAERIFQRLRDEHSYTGCVSIVRAAVAQWKQSRAEVFVPLAHPPGEAQVDFGQAEVVILLGNPGTGKSHVATALAADHPSRSTVRAHRPAAPISRLIFGHLPVHGNRPWSGRIVRRIGGPVKRNPRLTLSRLARLVRTRSPQGTAFCGSGRLRSASPPPAPCGRPAPSWACGLPCHQSNLARPGS
jgi:hypothetical protein